MIWIFILAIVSYLIGSIPFGLIVGKYIKGIDIRTIGSGNIGTANAVRALGPFWGGMVFLGDCLKGALPVLAVLLISKMMPGAIPANLFLTAQVIGGLAAIIGHNYSVFLGFTGGKGIATSFGAFVVLNWKVALLSLLIWIICIVLTKISSLGSLLGSLAVPILLIVFKSPVEYIVFGFIACLFAFYKHRANIGRLLRGEERKISQKDEKTGEKDEEEKQES